MYCIDLTRDHISTELDLVTGDSFATWNHNK